MVSCLLGVDEERANMMVLERMKLFVDVSVANPWLKYIQMCVACTPLHLSLADLRPQLREQGCHDGLLEPSPSRPGPSLHAALPLSADPFVVQAWSLSYIPTTPATMLQSMKTYAHSQSLTPGAPTLSVLLPPSHQALDRSP